MAKVGDKFIYQYASGGLSGAVKSVEVTREDFEQVYDGKLTDYDLLLKHNLS